MGLPPQKGVKIDRGLKASLAHWGSIPTHREVAERLVETDRRQSLAKTDAIFGRCILFSTNLN